MENDKDRTTSKATRPVTGADETGNDAEGDESVRRRGWAELNTRRRWLARLSFPFMILAGLLAWRAYQASHGRLGPVPPWQVVLYSVAAAASLALGFMGVRERHRP